MPKVNEIKNGRHIGKSWSGKYIWQLCPRCGNGRWIQRNHSLSNRICRACANKDRSKRGADCPFWKRGELQKRGYIYILLQPEDFFYSMCDNNGYVPEQRLVMAKYLNRCLLPWEVVHHKNGIKNDNRLENLELLPTRKQHLPDVLTKAKIKKLEKQVHKLQDRITLLEAENILLKQPQV